MAVEKSLNLILTNGQEPWICLFSVEEADCVKSQMMVCRVAVPR